MKPDQTKVMKCLKCDKLFRTSPETRICGQCKLSYNAVFDWQDEGKKYGNMGIWENRKTV